MQHRVHISQLNIDIDSEEFPQIVKVPSILDQDSGSAFSDQMKLSVLETEIETHLEQIKKLQTENEFIIKERDEVLEEYEDELKAVKTANDYLERENMEIKQEIKILYSQVEDLHNENDKLQSLACRNRELELLVSQKKNIISQLQETNKILSDSFVNANFEKAKVLPDPETLQTLEPNLQSEEIDRLRQELIKISLLYAESQTEKGVLEKRLNGQMQPKRFTWKFWKFWKNS